MSSAQTLDLFREVLDHELVDADGVSCGMVDDLELTLGERGLEITALWVGTRAWLPRLPALVAWIMGRVFKRRPVRVPWSCVERIDELVRLNRPAAELGLGVVDRRIQRWMERRP
jgi:sporulation protein YlmC with PRC-barrel domain